MDIIKQLLIICPLVFFAGFVDSIAGGGGIISLPAYYAAGLSPHMALGTNKFASTFGTTLSTYRFVKNKKFILSIALVSVPTALIGSAAGARLALYLSDIFLKYVLIIALPVLAVFILRNKRFGEGRSEAVSTGSSLKRTLTLSALTGAVIGAYDGFFGPGTGTFLILVFNTIIGLDLLTASGNAKIVNLSSNLAALFTFLLSGNVLFLVAAPAALCSIAGNYAGSSLALKNGAKVIRPVFLVVFVLLIVKVAFELFAG